MGIQTFNQNEARSGYRSADRFVMLLVTDKNLQRPKKTDKGQNSPQRSLKSAEEYGSCLINFC